LNNDDDDVVDDDDDDDDDTCRPVDLYESSDWKVLLE
jgi:hypothetical protein